MFTEYLIIAFCCLVLFSLLYWQIFYIVVLKQLIFRLFALRDEARRLAIDNDLAETKEFKSLEGFICKLIHISPQISLVSFIAFSTLNRNSEIKSYLTSVEFEKNAPKEFQTIRDAASKNALLIMALNSPFAVLMSSLAPVLLLAFGVLTRMAIYKKTEQFMETVECPPCDLATI